MPVLRRSNAANSDSTMSNASEPILVDPFIETDDEHHDDTNPDDGDTRAKENDGDTRADENDTEEGKENIARDVKSTMNRDCIPKMSSLFYNNVEFDLHASLAILFEYFQRAAIHENIYIVFGCGMAVGGLFGSYGTAFGVGFATSIFQTRYNEFFSFVCLSAIVASALLQLYSLELVGWYHIGSMVHKFVDQSCVDPYDASSMTIAFICCITSSYFLAFLIWAIYAQPVIRGVVEQSQKKMLHP